MLSRALAEVLQVLAKCDGDDPLILTSIGKHPKELHHTHLVGKLRSKLVLAFVDGLKFAGDIHQLFARLQHLKSLSVRSGKSLDWQMRTRRILKATISHLAPTELKLDRHWVYSIIWFLRNTFSRSYQVVASRRPCPSPAAASAGGISSRAVEFAGMSRAGAADTTRNKDATSNEGHRY